MLHSTSKHRENKSLVRLDKAGDGVSLVTALIWWNAYRKPAVNSQTANAANASNIIITQSPRIMTGLKSGQVMSASQAERASTTSTVAVEERPCISTVPVAPRTPNLAQLTPFSPFSLERAQHSRVGTVTRPDKVVADVQ